MKKNINNLEELPPTASHMKANFIVAVSSEGIQLDGSISNITIGIQESTKTTMVKTVTIKFLSLSIIVL